MFTDTIIGYVSSDISIVTGSLPSVGSENLSIQPSLSSEINLFFDLSKIPQNAVINSASLTLTVDPAETKMSSDLHKFIEHIYFERLIISSYR